MSSVNQELFLCLDQGGHASRCLAVDEKGRIQAQAFTEIDTHRDGSIVEHDPQQLVDSLRASASEVLSKLAARTRNIVAAGLATQRSSIVCWDKRSGEPLSPVLSWQDTRAADWLAGFDAEWARVHGITGLALSAHYGASKLRWCLDNIPAVSEAKAGGNLIYGPLAAYLTQQLTGNRQALADPANASRTLLWDRKTRDWSPELLTLFGIDAEDLPRCVPSRSRWGDLEIDAVDVPLTVVTGDQSAAFFAFGVPDMETASINMGTGAFVQRRSPSADIEPGRLLASVVYQDADNVTSVVEGTVNGAGSAIDAVATERQISLTTVHEQSADWLQQTAAPPLFINTLSGLGSPWWRVDVDAGFEPEPKDDPEAMVAVMESVVFLIAVNLSKMDSVLEPAEKIVLTGGLASVDPLAQRLANLTQRPVARARVREATAVGLGFLLAELPATWPPMAVEKQFAPETDAALLERFERWCQLMPVIE